MDDKTVEQLAFANIPYSVDPFTGQMIEDPVVMHRDLSDWWPEQLHSFRDDRLLNVMIVNRHSREDYYNKLKHSGIVIGFSGGLDSATLLHWCLELFDRVDCVSFDYSQRHSIEIEFASEYVQKLVDEGRQVTHRVVNMQPINDLAVSALTRNDVAVPRNTPVEEMGKKIPPTFVPGRNVYFVTALSQVAYQQGYRHVALGVNVLDYSGYPDCRPEFITAMRRALSVGIFNGMDFAIHAPLMFLNKVNIIRLGMYLGVRYQDTHSCYTGVKGGCGECDSCQLRRAAFIQLGFEDPTIAKYHKV